MAPRGRPFPKGRSGNPAGRPKGVKDKRKLLADIISDKDERAIRKAVVDAAKQGDLVAAKLIWDRIYPVRNAAEQELEDMIEALEDRLGEIERLKPRAVA